MILKANNLSTSKSHEINLQYYQLNNNSKSFSINPDSHSHQFSTIFFAETNLYSYSSFLPKLQPNWNNSIIISRNKRADKASSNNPLPISTNSKRNVRHPRAPHLPPRSVCPPRSRGARNAAYHSLWIKIHRGSDDSGIKIQSAEMQRCLRISRDAKTRRGGGGAHAPTEWDM